MKRMKKLLSLLLLAVLLLSLIGCDGIFPEKKDDSSEGEKTATELLWETATYTEDVTLGEGAKTVTVVVKALEKSITVTIKTDKDNLGDALLECGLAEGEMGAYGLQIKKVNGIVADYDIDATYWSFCQNGQALMYGVSDAKIVGGESYELVRAK